MCMCVLFRHTHMFTTINLSPPNHIYALFWYTHTYETINANTHSNVYTAINLHIYIHMFKRIISIYIYLHSYRFLHIQSHIRIVSIYLYIHKYKSSKVKVNLATIVEGDQKAPFSIATTLRCRGGHYIFPCIAPFYSWYVPYIAEC